MDFIKNYPIIKSHFNAGIFDQPQISLVQNLLLQGQEHLFSDWDPVGKNDEDKKNFLNQMIRFNESYPGGINGYIENSRYLLDQLQFDKNPYDGFTPTTPPQINLSQFDKEYLGCEELALNYTGSCAFVLVAGGMGERLGYSDIKINFPFDSIRYESYLSFYAAYILALQIRTNKKKILPFVIMTSKQTHSATITTLEKNNYFQLHKDQVFLVEQELVPTLTNLEAKLAKDSTYSLLLKPHGHGDVHLLLYQQGLIKQFNDQGISHIIFFQDTNAQISNIVLPALGASIKYDLSFNAVCVPRVPKEAVGAFATLEKDSEKMSINIEYNLLDSLLKSSVHPEGDAPLANGFSPFPGNTNVFILKSDLYLRILNKTKGIISEFVNPKFNHANQTNETKKEFAKPTRLETLMQDIAKHYTADDHIAVSLFNRAWAFSPNKNNTADGAKKAKAMQPPETATTAESDFYLGGRLKIKYAGNHLEAGENIYFREIPFYNEARIILTPKSCLTLQDVKSKIKESSFDKETTLFIDGIHIAIHKLKLTGKSALCIQLADDVHLEINDLHINNEGFHYIPLTKKEINDVNIPEHIRLRGFKVIDKGALKIHITEKGKYRLGANGEVIKQGKTFFMF